MIKVKKGQDPYSVIGQYIIDHVSTIEDMIAVIEINGKTSNELFMVDMEVDGYFIWKNDWYEGEENVVLIDFFPVSDACNPKDYWIPCSDDAPKEYGNYLITEMPIGDSEIEPYVATYFPEDDEWTTGYPFRIVRRPVIAWRELPEPYRGENE